MDALYVAIAEQLADTRQRLDVIRNGLDDHQHGTARIRPSAPHIQPQNITATNTATELTLRGAAERDRRQQESLERRDRDEVERDQRHHRRRL